MARWRFSRAARSGVDAASRRGARLGLAALAVLLLGGGTFAAEHPPLVSLESTSCTACHDELLDGVTTTHPPAAEDCTSCHEMAIGAEGTSVRLAESGPALCLRCHDDLEAAARGELAAPHYPVTESCVTCHNPHGSSHDRLLLDSQLGLCSSCHDRQDLNAAHKGQLTSAVACSSCHDPHGSSHARLLLAGQLHPPFELGSCDACHREPLDDRIRLRRRGERLCTACHDDLTNSAGSGGSVHAALEGERGRAGCLSCHNPHMSERRRLLLEPSPALCVGCHASILSPAPGSQASSMHPPASEDCLNCHLPHASEQRRLLVDSVESLCQACHDVEDAELAARHLGADPAGLDCVACHTPHASEHDSLLARNLHPPILEGCDTCHEGAAHELMEDGESALCLMCHDDIGEVAANATVPHPALEIARCADCHNPHASPQAKLVLRPGGEVCTACHDEPTPGAGETGHGVIEWIGCQACHEPHGGSNAKLLRLEGSNLCLGCHDPRLHAVDEAASTVTLQGRFRLPLEETRRIPALRLSPDNQRNHPVTNHRALGTPTAAELDSFSTTFRGELSCLVCHDPHKGRHKLLRWEAATSEEACLHCHPK